MAKRLGPFDTPFQPTVDTAFIQHQFAPQPSPTGLAALEAARRGAPYLMAAETSAVAAPYIYATGEEVLPLGGFTGVTPSPTAAAAESKIAAGDFHVAIIATPGATPGAGYIAMNCLHLAQPKSQHPTGLARRLNLYYCNR